MEEHKLGANPLRNGVFDLIPLSGFAAVGTGEFLRARENRLKNPSRPFEPAVSATSFESAISGLGDGVASNTANTVKVTYEFCGKLRTLC